MSKILPASRLNMAAFAQEGNSLVETTLLQNMERLAQEIPAETPDLVINWEARAELRPVADAVDDIWLYLKASTLAPLVCQRCMGCVATPLNVEQWYRFVATEDIAMAQDDESEEDLLVMEPQFDLIALLEDELLMALPLVPMHDQCQAAPVLSAGIDAVGTPASEKPNPFAMLADLKKKKP